MDPISYLAGMLTLPAIALFFGALWLITTPGTTTRISCDHDPWTYVPGAATGWMPPWWWERLRWRLHTLTPTHRNSRKQESPEIDLYGDGENERWPS